MVAKYLRAAHFLPTLLVTTLVLLLSRTLFNTGDSILIALTIFSGQLVVGWSNDLIDAPRDRIQRRWRKPVASGELAESDLKLATYVVLALCVALSLLGPLGIRGGSLHLLAVGFGLSYNLYLKNNLLSPIPFMFAFAALPATLYIAAHKTPPLWIVICGGLFGIVGHFANVLKDMDEDLTLGIRGLPHIIGTKKSIFIAAIGLILISLIISIHRQTLIPWFVISLPLAIALITYNPRKFGHPTIMLLALIDVYLLF